MKNAFSTIVMTLIIICIIGIFGIFGYIAIEEIWLLEEIEQETPVSENEGVDLLLETGSQDISNNIITNTIDNNIKTPGIIANPFDAVQSSSASNQNENKTNETVQIDKFFYNQLDEHSKIFYESFEKYREEMKTGKYKISFGDKFEDLLKTTNGQDLLGQYYQSAIEAFMYDNAEIFYLSPSKLYLNIEKTTRGTKVSYNVFINNGKENNYLADGFSSKEDVENAISQIESVKNQILQNKTNNTYNNIKMVHDYLIDTISYDQSISKPNIYNIVGALVNKVSVCEGYARAFKYLMDELGINCTMVIGRATSTDGKTENHAWNYVELNGTWYAVDCTWDDPVISGNGKLTNEDKYRYFLKGSTTMNKDHVPSRQFTDGGRTFEYPSISESDY